MERHIHIHNPTLPLFLNAFKSSNSLVLFFRHFSAISVKAFRGEPSNPGPPDKGIATGIVSGPPSATAEGLSPATPIFMGDERVRELPVHILLC